MDTVHFGAVFAFTAVDIFTREADVLLRPSLLAKDGAAFLMVTMPGRFGGFTQTIQTDGGSEFRVLLGGSGVPCHGGSEFEAEFHATAPYFCRQHHPNKASDRTALQKERAVLHRELQPYCAKRVLGLA